MGFGFSGGGGGGFFPTTLPTPTPLPTEYGGGGAAVSLLKEPGGGGGGFLKADAFEDDLEGGGIPREVRELAVDTVVLDLPRPPPPVSALLDWTNRAGGGEKSNRSGHGVARRVPTCADNSLGDGHILNLLRCVRPFGFVIGSDVMKRQGDVIFAFGKAGELLQDHIVNAQSVVG